MLSLFMRKLEEPDPDNKLLPKSPLEAYTTLKRVLTWLINREAYNIII